MFQLQAPLNHYGTCQSQQSSIICYITNGNLQETMYKCTCTSVCIVWNKSSVCTQLYKIVDSRCKCPRQSISTHRACVSPGLCAMVSVLPAPSVKLRFCETARQTVRSARNVPSSPATHYTANDVARTRNRQQ